MLKNEELLRYAPVLQTSIYVAEKFPKPIAAEVISYPVIKGDIIKKREILIQLSDLFEVRKEELATINKTLADNISFAFNKFNIRNNNIDSKSSDYCKCIASLSNDDLEFLYDETYEMSLLGFLELDNIARNRFINVMKIRATES